MGTRLACAYPQLMRRARCSKLKTLTTMMAAGAWLAVCLYLYAWWPGLAAALDIHLPRTAVLALGGAAPVALRVKDGWLRARTAMLVDALIAAPPLLAIAFFLYPFLVPIE
jgi:hypothetical protein